jgi:group I intron endonuclease
MQEAIVYLVTNMIDGKTYVGLTRFDVAKRWAEHKQKASCQTRSWLHRAIAKYGAENFSIAAVASCLSLETAKAVERDVIKSLTPPYNQTGGGEFTVGRRLSAEAKAKIAAGQIGRKHSVERVAANSASAKMRHANNAAFRATSLEALKRGRANVDAKKRIAAAASAAHARVWSDASRAKLSASCLGRKLSPEVIRKIAVKRCKAVECLELATVFDSAIEAARQIGVSNSSIGRVCNGQRKSVNGLHFIFADNT